MKRIKLISFIIVFLLIITLPLIFIDRKSVISGKENRALAVFPGFPVDKEGRMDFDSIKNIPRAINDYINDRFGFRNTFVSFANIIISASNNISGNAVIGKDGWLFYSNLDDGNNINDFFKLNLFSEAEINRLINKISEQAEWCRSNNIKFLFLVTPNKHNVYPEYYPFERPEGITRTEQLMGFLPNNLKSEFLYPVNILIQNKNAELPLYYETDTHWNMAGAYCVFELLMDRLKQLFPDTEFPNINFVTDVNYDFSGDIVPMLGYKSNKKRTVPVIHPIEGWSSYYQYIKNEERSGIITKNADSSLPKAIIFRDSFFTLLEPFTSAVFSSAQYYWKWFEETDREDILKSKPDIIILQIAERAMTFIP